MNRRDFVKASLCTAIGLVLSLEFSSKLVIVDAILPDEEFWQWLAIGKTHIDKDGSAFADVTINTEVMWSLIRLVDEDGREWHTDDEGTTWHCNSISFSLAEPAKV